MFFIVGVWLLLMLPILLLVLFVDGSFAVVRVVVAVVDSAVEIGRVDIICGLLSDDTN